MIEYTSWLQGLPVRPGWYNASAERNRTTRRHFDGTTWSQPVDEAAPDAERRAALAVRIDPIRARSIEYRGLTRASHRALAAELAR